MKKIILADISQAISKWENECLREGMIPVGIFHLASIDPDTMEENDVRYKIVGDKSMALVSTSMILDILAGRIIEDWY